MINFEHYDLKLAIYQKTMLLEFEFNIKLNIDEGFCIFSIHNRFYKLRMM